MMQNNEHQLQDPVIDFTAFDLKDVVVTDSYYQNSLQMEVNYLLQLEGDRLLAGFRKSAGLDTKGVSCYNGWENSLIGGHTLGHYLTATSQACVNEAITEEEKSELYQKITYLVDGLLECQQHSKGKKGFIFGATVLDSNNVELQFDHVEENKTNITTQAWVPWYTMHKILAGLVEVYELTGYETAKTVASNLADWVYDRTSRWSDVTQRTVLNIEYGGMNDCLYEVYKITGNEHHAEAAHKFDEITLFEKVKANTDNALNNLHANTTIPKFLGALNRYRALGKSERIYLEYAESFWDMVVQKHTYITGGNSEWEHFGEDDVLDAERTNCNCETCNTYNMLKLSKALFEATGDVKYADFYETTITNAILSSQNPETGMSMYFQPMASGYFKVYGSPFNHFWCCTGSGMENFTKLNDGIYYHNEKAIIVNRYVSSEVTWEEKNLKLVQKTDLPSTSDVTFTMEGLDKSTPSDVQLGLRIPDYAAGNLTVTVDGVASDSTIVNQYILLNGPFQNGSVIHVNIPIKVKAFGLPDNENVYAFEYGPVVLSAELGNEDMKTTTTGVNVSIPASKKMDFTKVILHHSQSSVQEFMEHIEDHLVRSGNSLTFTLKDTDEPLTFSPHYKQYQQRYAIYLSYQTERDAKADQGHSFTAEKERLNELKLDTVQPGYGQYENDPLHNLKEHDSVGSTSDGTSRYAKAGGYFTYQMIAAKQGPTYLLLTLKDSDVGKSLKVAVGEVEDKNQLVLYEGIPENPGKEDYFDLVLTIPESAVQTYGITIATEDGDQDVIPITFESAKDSDSASICNFLYTYRSLVTDTSIV